MARRPDGGLTALRLRLIDGAYEVVAEGPVVTVAEPVSLTIDLPALVRP